MARRRPPSPATQSAISLVLRAAMKPPSDPTSAPASSNPSDVGIDRNTSDAGSIAPASHEPARPLHGQKRDPQNAQRDERARSALNQPFRDEWSAYVAHRRADQLHDVQLVAPREQRQAHHAGHGKSGGKHQQRGQCHPAGANDVYGVHQPLNPLAIVANVGDARELRRGRGQRFDCDGIGIGTQSHLDRRGKRIALGPGRRIGKRAEVLPETAERLLFGHHLDRRDDVARREATAPPLRAAPAWRYRPGIPKTPPRPATSRTTAPCSSSAAETRRGRRRQWRSSPWRSPRS